MPSPTSFKSVAYDAKAELFATAVFFAGLAAVFAAPLLSRLSWLVFIQDDLLYYLQVARNIATGHGSTFNQIVPTNGYQPLWLLILIPLCRLTENPKVLLGFIAALSYIAAIATFFLSRRILKSTGIRPLTVFSLCAWVTLYSSTLFFYGMEVTLTVPLMLGVLCNLREVDWSNSRLKHTFFLGLLMSAMVLSRLDTLLFGGLLLVGILLSAELRRLLTLNRVSGALLGLTPIVCYFGINHTFFGTWLPISGMAKELKFGHMPSAEPWRMFLHPLAGIFTVTILSALCISFWLRRSQKPMERVIVLVTLLFPFVYYFVLSCVSDWTLWGWYMYPIRLALCVSFFIFCLWRPTFRPLQTNAVTAVLVVSAFAGLAGLRWTHQQTDITAASLEIQTFAGTHPGVYAMGDRAGRVGWLIRSPVIQTEGLMMDRPYLRLVENQTPLRQALGHYNVRYYIATAYEPFQGCFQASEPAKAGSSSAHMKAEFCQSPVASFTNEGVQTLIYDLAPDRLPSVFEPRNR